MSRGEVDKIVLMDRILDWKRVAVTTLFTEEFVSVGGNCHLPVHTSSAQSERLATDDFSNL